MVKVISVLFPAVGLLLILAIIALLVATIMFNRMVEKEVQQLLSGVEKEREMVKREDLTDLPPCVQRWLEHSHVIGKEKIRLAHLSQKIMMRMSPQQPWMPAVAEQYCTVKKPGFVWKVKVKFKSFMVLTGRDKYYEGHGHMLIKIFSLIQVANAQGEEVDQGTLLRYLAEMVWLPTAALSGYLKWEEVDANSARVTMTYKGVTASGVFTFDEKGDFLRVISKRYRQVKGGFQLDDWIGEAAGYSEFGGIRIPSKMAITWKLAEGDFNWYICEISAADFGLS